MPFGLEVLDLPEGIFTILRDLIRERTGLHFEADRRGILADKLSPRALEHDFASFLDYYYLLKYGPNAEAEWPMVLDALSVPETYFWREMDQIRALVDVLVPRHVAAQPSRRVDIWCAACASGEEPMTIAIALQEAGWFERASIRIRASDASQSALARARSGCYRERSFRSLPPMLRDKYFTREGDIWKIDARLHDHVEWSQVNLMHEGEISPLVGTTFIFCRNVFIYFSPATMAQTVQRFSKGMPRPGFLFTGAAESLVRNPAGFDLREIAGAFVYVLE